MGTTPRTANPVSGTVTTASDRTLLWKQKGLLQYLERQATAPFCLEGRVRYPVPWRSDEKIVLSRNRPRQIAPLPSIVVDEQVLYDVCNRIQGFIRLGFAV